MLGGAGTELLEVDTTLLDVADEICLLAMHPLPTRWITRTIERISILDNDVSHRRVEVHVDVARAVELAQRLNGRVVLPIALLSRNNGREIQVTDSRGYVLPRLNRREERCIAYKACVQLLTVALETHPGGPPAEPELTRQIRLQRMYDALWRELVVDPPPASNQTAAYSIGGVVIPTGSDAWNIFATAVATLCRSFMLLVEIPDDLPLRQSLVYEYDVTDVESTAAPVPVVPLSLRGLLESTKRGIRKLLRPFAGAPAVERQFSAPTAGYTASYHLEVIAPDELHVVDTELTIEAQDPNDPNGRVFERLSDDPRMRGSAHIHFELGDWIVRKATVKTFLYAPDYGLSTTAMLVSVLNLVVLVVAGFARFGLNVFAWWGAETTGAARELVLDDRSGATAILLLAPGVMQILAFRYGESRVVARVYRRTRTTLSVVTLPTAALAVLVAFRTQVDHPARVWLVFTCFALVGALCLLRQRWATASPGTHR